MRIYCSTDRKENRGSSQDMLEAFQERLEELSIETATAIEAAYAVDSVDMSVTIPAYAKNRVYKDVDGGFGEPGELYTLEDIMKIWNDLHTSDPSMSYYNSFDEWFEDTKDTSLSLVKCCSSVRASSDEDEEGSADDDIEGSSSFAYDWEMNGSFEKISSKQVPDSDGFYTDYTMYKNLNTGEYVFVFGDNDYYSPEDGVYDYECDSEEEAWEWFNSYSGFDDIESSEVAEVEDAEDTIEGSLFSKKPKDKSSDMQSKFAEYQKKLNEVGDEFDDLQDKALSKYSKKPIKSSVCIASSEELSPKGFYEFFSVSAEPELMDRAAKILYEWYSNEGEEYMPDYVDILDMCDAATDEYEKRTVLEAMGEEFYDWDEEDDDIYSADVIGGKKEWMLLNEVGGMLECSDNANDIATAIKSNKFPTGTTVALVVDDEIRDELPVDMWMKEFGDGSIFSSTSIKANRDDNYFGEEAAFKYGDIITNQLGVGATISKRQDSAEEPGGLIYVANELGIGMWDLLEALEGMCADGRASEIDDSTYKIVSTKRHPVRSLFYNEADDPNSRWASVTTASTIADNGQEVFQLMSYSSDPGSGMEGDDFYCYGEFFAADRQDAEQQLEVAKQEHPEFFVSANPYSDVYIDDYNEHFATGDEIYQNVSAIIQNIDVPEWAQDPELPFASTNIKASYQEGSLIDTLPEEAWCLPYTLNESQKVRVDDIANRFSTSSPVSGSWDTELQEEMLMIGEELAIDEKYVNYIMINYLGFDPDEVKSAWADISTTYYDQLNSATTVQSTVDALGEEVDWLVDNPKEEYSKDDFVQRKRVACPYCTQPTDKSIVDKYGMCWDCYDNGVE